MDHYSIKLLILLHVRADLFCTLQLKYPVDHTVQVKNNHYILKSLQIQGNYLKIFLDQIVRYVKGLNW